MIPSAGARSAGPPTPPAAIPLGFLAASGLGLIAFAVALASSAPEVTSSHLFPGVIATAHLGVLAFLSTAVLGAVHQFGPVAANRPLRSVAAARITLAVFVPAVWILPAGFAAGEPRLVSAAGAAAAGAVLLAAWNLSGPLAVRGGGVPVAGLRMAVALLVATVGFGVLFALDRHEGWFDLDPMLVAAHAHLGLLGWLGCTYFAVAEKLWPMFMLAHRPRAAAGRAAVGLIGTGAPLLAVGLVASWPWLIAGAALVLVGAAAAHLASLAGAIRARRRPLELLHAFVLSSAASLIAAVFLGAAALLSDGAARLTFVRAEVVALIGWLTLAVVGHAHKIVPFISYLVLRSAGVTNTPEGKPLSFADLFSAAAARATLALSGAGVICAVGGTVASSSALVATGGVSIAVGGSIALVNLGLGPVRALSAHRTGARVVETPS